MIPTYSVVASANNIESSTNVRWESFGSTLSQLDRPPNTLIYSYLTSISWESFFMHKTKRGKMIGVTLLYSSRRPKTIQGFPIPQ